MIYKDFADKKLSALGMGCMRFPLTQDNEIDIDKTREIIKYAIENGVNYFDTAWGYHDGKSELVIGELLKEYPRDSFYLATKFPGFDVSNMENAKGIFNKQLEKCQVEYFDFYLFHCLCENNIDLYLSPEYGLFDYLIEQKKQGKIRHLGFSAHAEYETIKRFLDAYGEELEFAQLQINWIDWNFQKAKQNAELINSYNIPIWVMEPVRGGALATIPSQYEERLKKLCPTRPVVEWAFRFLQSIDVVVTLSGMSSFEQIKENIKIFETDEPLNSEEVQLLFDIAAEMTAKNTLNCTACRYCTTYCPQELDIPTLIRSYNEHIFKNSDTMTLDKAIKKRPDACLGCCACEAVCPQNIKISEMMSDFAKRIK